MTPSFSTGSAEPTAGQPVENVVEFHLVHDVEPYGTYAISWYCCRCGTELGWNTLDRGGEPADGCCRKCGSDNISWCEWSDIPGIDY